ncbi:MAG: DUF4347 domain-containing protein, partial [Deltaproteobacteria bacterium]|nr:DUF4347 domain-containing protein [Deltaproteobacteria bacterium]
MPGINIQAVSALGSPDTSIHFEALEPRLLLSGSPDDIFVDNQLSELSTTELVAVEVVDAGFQDEDFFDEGGTSIFDEPNQIKSEASPLDGFQEIPASDPLSVDTAAGEDPVNKFQENIEIPGNIDTDPTNSTDQPAGSDVGDDCSVAAEEPGYGTVSASEPDAGAPADNTPEDTIGTDHTGTVDEATETGSLTMQAQNPDNGIDQAIIMNTSVDRMIEEIVRQEVVFINDDIQDHDQLTEDLSAKRMDGREITVVTLASNTDGIEQISSVLSESENVNGVHFVSHGTDRAVKLGGTWIDSANINDYASDISRWQEALAEDADLLFYGCNLACGEAGRSLLGVFKDLTDADVAASTDNTGHSLYGADWDLEYSAGIIDTVIPFSDDLQASWSALLDTFTVTKTSDAGAGSLREAILAANALAGTDTIEFNIAGAGPHTIQTTSALPNITDSVVIDGTTEPDFVSTPVIVLDGTFAGAVDGLILTGDGSTIRGLVINNFNNDGIEIQGDNNVIAGNFIGTDVTGTAAAANGDDGVDIRLGGAGNIIGGNTAADRNIISGNAGEGIKIDGAGSTGNVVQGNYIGTDVTGTVAIANGDDGIEITNGANSNTIGGTTAAVRNIISSNLGEGIDINGAATTGNVIQGNYIGTDVNASANLGNSGSGIYINNAGSNTIGGTGAGEGNVIAFNNSDGVTIMGTSSGITIRGNSIHSNDALGLDFNDDGVTENDLDDVDGGPNSQQNFPVLTSNDTDLNQITISGTLNSVADTTYTIDFYSSSAQDDTGNGEGEVYLGSTTCATDGGGDGSFNVTLPATVTVGHFISATATDPSGNTSEFSDTMVAAATNDAPTVTTTVADLAYTEGDGAVLLDDGITVADVDDTNIESATIQIT